MKRAAVVTAVAVLGLTLTACTDDDKKTGVVDKPDRSAASQPADTPSGAATTPAPAKEAKVGDPITVTGQEDGQQVQVTLKKIADPAKPADEFTEPDAGNRWVGAQFEIVNTGTVDYDDSPGNGSQIADSEGQRFGTTFAEITAGPSMTASAKAKPGAKVLGWLVYEVPKNAKLASVQFGMNSGFADETAEWKLG
ncbi:DUF4352 domain-containing protein [Streptomyces sp. NPDC047315]|uniref:DUF4352 domain-containing protein n=1 Tax=Streptomyces sp. NPDC047315 TaxID=3155142 RepID=UPI0033FCA5C7